MRCVLVVVALYAGTCIHLQISDVLCFLGGDTKMFM